MKSRSRKRMNNVKEITNSQGSRLLDYKEIKVEAFQHFKNILSMQEE